LEIYKVIDFREIHFKVYRIIYEIYENEVFIRRIVDGIRDLMYILKNMIVKIDE